ncbi:MAG: type II toxin-antitoxin system RatA family toxin [Rhizobiales bacterium]|nr:type II toxin-antitoxin system RatA family toxin [Hyphomicrobiales bacterium]
MPSIHDSRDVDFSAADMFAMVGDVERYPEFLPWCSGARVRRREEVDGIHVLLADLMIAYKMFREQFTSRVSLDDQQREIGVALVKGPFKHLTNRWHFEVLGDHRCRVHFFLDFEFRSAILQKMMNGVFSKAFTRMMEAFIKRAEVLYGNPTLSGPTVSS